MDDNVYITPKKALELLDVHLDKRKKRVHTFEGMGGMLFGCDMDLTAIKKLFRDAGKEGVCISGKNMQTVKHGVAVFREGKGWLFIATQSWLSMAIND